MYTKEIIVKKSKELIASTLNTPEDHITLDAKLIDLTEDSIQLFELITAFESAFDLETKYEDIIRIETVGDVVRYLMTLLPVDVPKDQPVS